MTADQVMLWCGTIVIVAVTVALLGALGVLGYLTYKYLKESA